MTKQFSRSSKILSLESATVPVPMAQTEMCQAYDRKKRRVMSYRLIFIAFGILFTALTTTLFLKTPNWNYNVLFGYGMAAKTLLSIVTWVLGVAALWIGCCIRTEHELTREYHTKIKNHLIQSYKQKKAYTLLGTRNGNAGSTPHDMHLHQFFAKAREDLDTIHREADFQLDSLQHSSHPESIKKILKLEILSRMKNQLELIAEHFDQL